MTVKTKRTNFRWLLTAACVGIVAAGYQQSEAGFFGGSEADKAIAARLKDEAPLQIGGQTLRKETLQSYYEGRNHAPVWTDADGLNRRGAAALDVIRHAEEEGLSPEHYGLSAISKAQESLKNENENKDDAQATLELLIGDAVARYAHDVTYGATTPGMRMNRDFIAPAEAEKAPTELLTAAADAGNPGDYLHALSPGNPAYQSLKKALSFYRELDEKGGWPSFRVGKSIKPGMQDSRTRAAKEILKAMGDYTEADMSETYDEAMEIAVKNFQSRHGLEPDGALGPLTQKALAVPAHERTQQIIATMERLRWMPDNLGERYVVVNIPGYRLYANENGKTAFESKVIVGKKDTRTPLFGNAINQVIFNPAWNVPHKIAVKEMLPKIKEDPEYLSRGNYRLLEDGQDVDPQEINWEEVDNGNFNYSIRQRPGDSNALGKIKFSLPNSDAIYLHSTSMPKLFAKDERSLSHGCIRVEKPRELAQFVLMPEGWSTEKIDAAYESDAHRTVEVTPVKVYTVYWTAWVDDQGIMHFAPDIYGTDRKLAAMLSTADGKSLEKLKLATK